MKIKKNNSITKKANNYERAAFTLFENIYKKLIN